MISAHAVDAAHALHIQLKHEQQVLQIDLSQQQRVQLTYSTVRPAQLSCKPSFCHYSYVLSISGRGLSFPADQQLQLSHPDQQQK